MSTKVLVLIFTTGALLVGLIEAFPGGAPTSACESMTPGHGSSRPQTSNSPYTTTPLLTNVNSTNVLVPINLDGLAVNNPFKGFLAMAFDTRSPDGRPIGTFELFNPNDAAQLINCQGGVRNAVTHINREDKRSVMVNWAPPPGFNGQIIFKVTYVRDFNTYWVKVNSAPITVSTPADQGSTTVSPPTTRSSASNILGNFWIEFALLMVLKIVMI